MSTGDYLRLFLILVGFFLLGMTIVSLARRRMTESFCIAWGIVSVLFIALGIILRPVGLSGFIGTTTLLIIFLSVIFVIVVASFFSVRMSNLMRQTEELAIQVSLLNYENEVLAKEFAKLAESAEKKGNDHGEEA